MESYSSCTKVLDSTFSNAKELDRDMGHFRRGEAKSGGEKWSYAGRIR